MVTMRSCIACSKAAWVLGGVRLISSASSSWVKIGPFDEGEGVGLEVEQLVPMTSPGIRSGVNWTRPKSSDRARAKAWASRVFAVPGTPSSRICPSDNRADQHQIERVILADDRLANLASSGARS